MAFLKDPSLDADVTRRIQWGRAVTSCFDSGHFFSKSCASTLRSTEDGCGLIPSRSRSSSSSSESSIDY
ncbi:hypothetical protein RRG08_056223 [Elysia crispata]|uniref:Uncharacterized protein n=1 Tax=Elysia crispata TaxID=231223 RepID=A0AAE1D0D6_9GAST|nr:hypothetical protein RRG08_056223 [Elysia crispata]